MKRREFIKSGTVSAIATGAALKAGDYSRPFAVGTKDLSKLNINRIKM